MRGMKTPLSGRNINANAKTREFIAHEGSVVGKQSDFHRASPALQTRGQLPKEHFCARCPQIVDNV